jgi:hypothetical protein
LKTKHIGKMNGSCLHASHQANDYFKLIISHEGSLVLNGFVWKQDFSTGMNPRQFNQEAA